MTTTATRSAQNRRALARARDENMTQALHVQLSLVSALHESCHMEATARVPV